MFSIYTGTKLISNLDKKSGIILSIINQILQLVQWNVLGYGFSYSSGAEILIGFKGLSLSFNFSALSSSFNMSINSEGDFYLKINVLAIVIIYILYDILKSRQVNKGLA